MTDAFLVNRRVLVVEEDQAVRDLMCDVFEFWGAQVTAGGVGEDTVEPPGVGRFDLVVLSWDFEAVNPRRMLTSIDLLKPAGPGLVVTTARGLGSGPVPARVGGQKLPVIVKPFCLEALRKAARAALVSAWTGQGVAAKVHQLSSPIAALLRAADAGTLHEVA